jgi:multidrug efflux pump subunit AcrB
MFLIKSKAGAVALVALCTMASPTALSIARALAHRDNGHQVAALAAIASASPGPPQDPAADAAAKAEKPPAAGGDGVVPSKGRILTPDGKLMYVNVYSTNEGVDQNFLSNYVTLNILPEIKRVRGVGTAAILGNRTSAMRIRLNPDRMRAHNLSSNDIMAAFSGCSMVGSPGRLVQATEKTSQSEENVLTHIGRYNKPDQYENIILKASPEGDILRLKDVGEVELDTQLFDIDADVDGHPSAVIVLKQAPGSDVGEVLEAITGKLELTKKESFPPGMNFEVIPLENPGMICAVTEPRRDSTLEYTSAKCHELSAIARGIDEITSVWSLAGYQIRTEGRGSNAGTCLIQLKDRSDRKLTSRQIIEKLEEKCRTMNVDLEFFGPPAVSVFVAAGGFSVRVLDKTNSNNDKRLGGVPETFMDDLLNRTDLEGLFTFLASNYPQHELIINNDMARQKGVSIANAMVNLPLVVGGDVHAERKFWRLAEDLSNLYVKNDRGEMVPYTSFVQLKEKPGLNEIGR